MSNHATAMRGRFFTFNTWMLLFFVAGGIYFAYFRFFTDSDR